MELLCHPCRPRHLHRSITGFLTPEAYTSLKQQTTYEEFLAFAKRTDVVKDAVHCILHGQDCKFLTAECHNAGIICVSWSPMGKGLKTDGLDYHLFISWVACRRHYKDLGFCVRCYCKPQAYLHILFTLAVGDMELGTYRCQ